MIISSHIILTVAAVSPMIEKPITLANISLAFVSAYLFHYFLDFIPHWDYELLSISADDIKDEKKFIFNKINIVKDIIKTATDGFIGLVVAFLMVSNSGGTGHLFMFGTIVIASILPDISEVFYAIWKNPLFNTQHKIHSFFHTSIKLKGRAVYGFLLQLLMVIAAFFLTV